VINRRAGALRDLPGTPLFSGRLDYSADAEAGGAALARAGSAAVIAADEQVREVSAVLAGAGLPHGVLEVAEPAAGLVVVPVSLAKGMEYDDVIVVEPARIAAAGARGLHRLYVALTRAVARLTVPHAEPLPEPLGFETGASR
jgi:hypothetical protein